MNTQIYQGIPTPPSLMKALKAGFDAITNHLELILFPICIDVFLWLGPHLRLLKIIENYLAYIEKTPGLNTPETTEFISLSQELWTQIGQRFNLFTFLRTFPVGVPSLMVSVQPVESPFGQVAYWDLTSVGILIVVWLLLSFVGLVMGTLYFWIVEQAALEGNIHWEKVMHIWPDASTQVILLALAWILLLGVISIPGSCLLSLLFMGGLAIGQVGVLVMGGLMIWILFPLLFSPHGIFVNQSKVWVSVRDSIRLTRYTFPTTGLLFLIILVLTEGLGILWRVPEETSWLTLVGLFGHAFITTGILAATFVYYRDANQWVQKVLQQVKVASS